MTPADHSNIKLLFVEDDIVDQMAFRRFMESERLYYSTRFASSVSEALPLLHQGDFDAVLSDYKLGDGTVFDLLPFTGDIPVIIVTGSGDEAVAVNAMKSGASDYLVKDEQRRYLRDFTIALERALTHKRWAIENRKMSERQSALLKKLEAANRDLRDFAHVISHDLKAPLRSIRSLVDWLAADYAEKFDDAGKEKMRLLSERAAQMHGMIDGILKYSQIGCGYNPRENVALEPLIRDVIAGLGPSADIRFDLHGPFPIIAAERICLYQVFQNLISNAINFLDKPMGRIGIHCRDAGIQWEFEVEDNGPGIEARNLERIFGLFQTAVPQVNPKTQSGIGLAIVRKLVESHGGKVWVHSNPGKGSCFHFSLPKEIIQIPE